MTGIGSVWILHQADGLITSVYQSSSGADSICLLPGQHVGPQLAPDHPACARPIDFRVVNGEVVERDNMAPTVSTATIAADGTATTVLGDLPDPCTVTITGAVTAGPVEVAGGALTLTSTQPGEIKVAVRADPTHKAWETTIHAA